MRTVVAICALTLTFVLGSSAAGRTWMDATWAPRQGTSFIVETARELVTADATPGTGALDATPGSPVQVAVEGSTVYVRSSATAAEHALALKERNQKYSADYTAIGSGHFIKSVSAGGTQVVLEDGSRWDVHPGQHFAVSAWQPDDLISVRRSDDDDDFAFEVDNTTQDDGTLANHRVR